jgi:DNA ligase (NAD+)
MEALEEAQLKEIEAVEDLGSVTAQSLYAFLYQDETRNALHQLYEVGVEVESMPSRRRKGPLEGKRFVFTGELQRYTRQEAAQRVEQLGGAAASTVSDDVDYVVVGHDPGRKLGEAKRKNVKTIDERTFQKLVGSRSGG